MKTWICPLCDFSTTGEDVLPGVVRHAVAIHPAYLPDEQTVAGILDSLPNLLREVALTVDAPNPDGPRVEIAKSKYLEETVNPYDRREDRVTWSRTPKVVRLVLKLNPGSEHSLFSSLVLCSRLVWEALDPEVRAKHGQPLGAPSWLTKLTWLRGVWRDAQAYLDPTDFDWIETELRFVWISIAATAGVRTKPRNLCPDCKAPMHLGDDDWLTCDAGHQHPGPKRMEGQWRRKPPMSSSDLCEALRIPRGTLRRWSHEGKIKPTRQQGQELFWLPWDAIALRYPDIVAGINERDTARVA